MKSHCYSIVTRAHALRFEEREKSNHEVIFPLKMVSSYESRKRHSIYFQSRTLVLKTKWKPERFSDVSPCRFRTLTLDNLFKTRYSTLWSKKSHEEDHNMGNIHGPRVRFKTLHFPLFLQVASFSQSCSLCSYSQIEPEKLLVLAYMW